MNPLLTILVTFTLRTKGLEMFSKDDNLHYIELENSKKRFNIKLLNNYTFEVTYSEEDSPTSKCGYRVKIGPNMTFEKEHFITLEAKHKSPASLLYVGFLVLGFVNSIESHYQNKLSGSDKFELNGIINHAVRDLMLNEFSKAVNYFDIVEGNLLTLSLGGTQRSFNLSFITELHRLIEVLTLLLAWLERKSVEEPSPVVLIDTRRLNSYLEIAYKYLLTAAKNRILTPHEEIIIEVVSEEDKLKLLKGIKPSNNIKPNYDVIWAKLDKDDDWVKYGVLYGFPPCCIHYFVTRDFHNGGEKNLLEGYENAGYIPCDYHKSLPVQEVVDEINSRRIVNIPFPEA